MKTFWIGGFPCKEDISRIKLFQDSLDLDEAVIPQDGYHVTLRYWEDGPDVTEEVISWLKSNSNLFRKIRAYSDKMERFGRDNDILVMRLKGDSLHNLFNKMNNALVDIGVPKSDYRTYKPHITLAENISRVPRCDLSLLKSVMFDRWELTDQDRNILWETGSKDNRVASWISRNCKFSQKNHESITKYLGNIINA